MRKANSSDIPFVFSTWLRSYRYDSPVTLPIPHDIYFMQHQLLLEKLLIRDGVRVLVSCDCEDPKHIFGWVCVEDPMMLHYIYVKRPLRKEGVARELISKAQLPINLKGVTFSHYTNVVGRLLELDKIRGEYNPYSLEGYGGKAQRAREFLRESMRDAG